MRRRDEYVRGVCGLVQYPFLGEYLLAHCLISIHLLCPNDTRQLRQNPGEFEVVDRVAFRQ